MIRSSYPPFLLVSFSGAKKCETTGNAVFYAIFKFSFFNSKKDLKSQNFSAFPIGAETFLIGTKFCKENAIINLRKTQRPLK